MKNAKEFMGEIIAKLNTAGFSGGFYKYKDGECSCCYGLKDTFFEVNENIPQNWGVHGTEDFYYKFTYEIENKERATEFRKIANRLARKYFGKIAQTAKSNFECIIINL